MSGNRATAHFTLPKNCTGQVVSLVSYKAPNGTDHKPFAEQTMFKATTRTFNISGARTMSVEVPDCFFQIDLVRGQPIQSFASGRTYSSEGRMLTASGGGSKSCNAPAATTQAAPVAPAVQKQEVKRVNNNQNDNEMEDEDRNNNQKEADEAEPNDQDQAPNNNDNGKLPDTGPGETAALSFGASMTAGLLFAYRRRYDSIVASIVSHF
jgi:hypothetical protein